MKKTILPILVSLVLFASCDKGGDDCDISVANLAGTYKITSIKVKYSGLPEIDGFATLDDCEKDDLQILEADGDFIYQDAGAVCSPAGGYAGTWSLSGNTLTLDGQAATITNFNCSQITLTLTDPSLPGAVVTSTLVKQ